MPILEVLVYAAVACFAIWRFAGAITAGFDSLRNWSPRIVVEGIQAHGTVRVEPAVVTIAREPEPRSAEPEFPTMPEDVIKYAAQESEPWAQEAVLKDAEKFFKETGHWDAVMNMLKTKYEGS